MIFYVAIILWVMAFAGSIAWWAAEEGSDEEDWYKEEFYG